MAILATSERDIHVRLNHLARDTLFVKEKPYAAVDFIPAGKPSNHSFESADVTIRDARPVKDSFTLEKEGFCFIDSTTSATFDVLKGRGPAIEAYHRETEEVIEQHFPEYSRVAVIDHWLRQRDPGFPHKTGFAQVAQPARLPHKDFSVPGLFMRMKISCPGQEQYYIDKDFDLINVWRVLHGPNNDWPLALCDYSTVDPEDSISNDYVTTSCVGENKLLHANPKHRWYYLSDQRVDELIVFRNEDSKGQRAHAFHAAVDSGVPQTLPRESIEVRLVAFRWIG